MSSRRRAGPPSLVIDIAPANPILNNSRPTINSTNTAPQAADQTLSAPTKAKSRVMRLF
jgi:hypothetical protein